MKTAAREKASQARRESGSEGVWGPPFSDPTNFFLARPPLVVRPTNRGPGTATPDITVEKIRCILSNARDTSMS